MKERVDHNNGLVIVYLTPWGIIYIVLEDNDTSSSETGVKNWGQIYIVGILHLVPGDLTHPTREKTKINILCHYQAVLGLKVY